jgi:hypothetical protein
MLTATRLIAAIDDLLDRLAGPRAPGAARGCQRGKVDARGNSSGASRNRTGDLLLAKQALSQLSYGPAAPSLVPPLSAARAR